MKTMHVFATAICAVACTFTAAIAEDDSGLESATPAAPVITDPVNPQPGMIFSAYDGYKWMYPEDSGDKEIEKMRVNLKESVDKLPALPAVKTGIDKSDKFSIACASGVAVAAIRWEGFLKCKIARTYTFLIQKERADTYDSRLDLHWATGYAIRINGKTGVVSYGQTSFDVNLKVGFNKVEIVSLLPDGRQLYKQGRMAPLLITVKPKGSVIEPVNLSPNKLFYDARPELTETGLDL
ncbi:MAG: hypothetical protein J6Z49_02145 [Kiritimatiellae bacterium]|nr:hypothetical protein [Kiritimatiellia bacterium]